MKAATKSSKLVAVSSFEKTKNRAVAAFEKAKETINPADLDYTGQGLINFIESKRVKEDLTLEELAIELEISVSTAQSIMKKRRDLGLLPMDVMKRIGNWLEIPTVQVCMLAGALSPEDFYAQNTVERKVNSVIELARKDPKWGGFIGIDAELAHVPLGFKMFAALLYQEKVGKQIIDSYKIERYVDESKEEDSKAEEKTAQIEMTKAQSLSQITDAQIAEKSSVKARPRAKK